VKTMLNSLIKKLSAESSLLQQITRSVELDNEEKSRRKLFSIFLILPIFPFTIFGITQLRMGHPEYGIPDLIFAAVMAVFLVMLRIVRNARFLYRTVSLIALVMFIYWLATGAVTGYSSVWLLLFPLFVYFLLGRREGSIWTLVLSIASICIFINPGGLLTGFTYPFEYVFRLLSTLCMIVLFVYYYETMREVFKSGMRADRQKILDEKNLLARAKEETEIANILLKKEMEERRIAQEEIRKHRDNLEATVARRTDEIIQKNQALIAALETLEMMNIDLQNSKDSLAASENRYRLLADNVIDMIWSTDMSLKFTYVSPSVKAIFGYTVEEAMALPFDKWSTRESNEKALNLIRESVQAIYGFSAEDAASRPFDEWSSPARNEKALEILHRRARNDPHKNDYADGYLLLEIDQVKKDGTVFPVEIKIAFLLDGDGTLMGTVGATRDVTERVQAQREKEIIQTQLAQAQKMEAIGTLVGGLAHDFNNILGGILGSFELIRLGIEKEPIRDREQIESFITMGMDSSKRSASLIKQLLTLSRKHTPTLMPVDINQSLRHIEVICRNSFPKSVTIDFRIADGSLFVRAEAVQMEQVLLNLCINASHAMTLMRGGTADEGGVLTVEAYKAGPGSDLLKSEPESAGVREWICVKVADTGVGIDPDARQRIFEPFFTTKKIDQGTGLGLSISYSIVRQHHGFIHLESEPGKGSSFYVYLPSHVPEGEEKTSDRTRPVFVKGSGTVLIIDDEEFITNVVRGILTNCGYRVLAENNPDRGIELFSRNHEDIAAVILDLSMPDKSGIEVYRDLLRIDPGVKVVLSSGMVDIEMKEKAAEMGITHFLHKPFNGEELTSAIAKLIREGGDHPRE
jgi:PAS domain S-box-containing protein